MGNQLNTEVTNDIVRYCRTGEIPIPKDVPKVDKRKTNQRKYLGLPDTIDIWTNGNDKDDIERTRICPICETNMMTLIDRTSWEISHILAHHNGGTEDLNNLRPVCRKCNRDMKTEHMLDYCKRVVPPERLKGTLMKLRLGEYDSGSVPPRDTLTSIYNSLPTLEGHHLKLLTCVAKMFVG
jgi:5-methylcytosine-specific restriction endonuclease McrA